MTTTITTTTALLATGVRMHHRSAGDGRRTVVLLHGWPETSWQWRHVLPLLADAGYRVIAPDLRGAGRSSRPRLDDGAPADPRAGQGLPRGGYDKVALAEDVHALLHDELGLTEPALVVGHDIGAMVAVAYALRFRGDVRALCFGEAPLPGTDAYEQMQGTVGMYHFHFHAQLDLPEALVAGRERLYLQHFVDRLGKHPEAVDTDHYAQEFSAAGALRAGFDLYRAFDRDARDTRAALAEGGRLTVPVLAVHGEVSAFASVTAAMGDEIAESVRVAVVPDTGHWLAEENPRGLVDLLLAFDAAPEG